MKFKKIITLLAVLCLCVFFIPGCYSDEEYGTLSVNVSYSGATVGQYLFIGCWTSREGMRRTLENGEEPDYYTYYYINSSSGTRTFRFTSPGSLVYVASFIGNSTYYISFNTGDQCEVFNDLAPTNFYGAYPVLVNENTSIDIDIDHTF